MTSVLMKNQKHCRAVKRLKNGKEEKGKGNFKRGTASVGIHNYLMIGPKWEGTFCEVAPPLSRKNKKKTGGCERGKDGVSGSFR